MQKNRCLALLLLLFTCITASFGQCKNFINQDFEPILEPYINSGEYHSVLLVEGEEALLYKTFFPGTNYRIAIKSTESISKIRFRVFNSNDELVYDNKSKDYSRMWNIKVNNTQQMKIFINIPPKSKNISDISAGCMAVLIGISDKAVSEN